MSSIAEVPIDSDVIFTLLVGALAGTLDDWLPSVTLLASCTTPLPLIDSAPFGSALVVELVRSIINRPAVTLVPPV
jgi:hypothetical protein